ncbi:MAG: hypothetical protein AAFU73_06140 [Planctomycetota bacterium]
MARRPALWLLAGATAAAGRVLDLALPFGLTTQRSHQLAYAYELAFMAGCLSAAMAVGHAIRFAPALRSAGGPARVFATVAVAVLASALVGAAAVLPAHATREWQAVAFESRSSLLALALGWTAFASLAACSAEWLGGTPRPSLTAPAAALVGLLLLPAALPAPLASPFDAGALLHATFDLSAEPAHWRAPVWSTLLWGSLAVARAAPPLAPSERSTHALRDPR